MEYGVVKFFDEREGKKFGFVRVLDGNGQETGEELFFHYNDRSFAVSNGDDIVFTGNPTKLINGKGYTIPVPQKGDVLAFDRAFGHKGDKASPWTAKHVIESVERQLATRPVYRVTKFATYYGKSEEAVVWEGQNIIELSAKFRKEEPGFGRRHGYDVLDGGTADSGDMYWHFSIEKQQEDGSWQSAKDPRVFACCVPANLYRQYSDGGRQPVCYHGNRR